MSIAKEIEKSSRKERSRDDLRERARKLFNVHSRPHLSSLLSSFLACGVVRPQVSSDILLRQLSAPPIDARSGGGAEGCRGPGFFSPSVPASFAPSAMSIRLSQSAEDEVFDEVKRTWERTYERKSERDPSAKNSICNYVFKRVCVETWRRTASIGWGQTEFDTIKRVMGRKVDEHFQGGRQQTADRRRDDDRPKYNAHERDHHRGGGGGYGGNGGHSGNGGYGGNGNRNGGHGGNGNGGYGHGNGGNDRGYGGGNGGGYGGSNGATHGNGNPGRRPREEEANGGDGGGGGTFVLPPASQRQATGDGILRRLPVLTNCARIKVDPTLVSYHYDVTFIPEIKDEDGGAASSRRCWARRCRTTATRSCTRRGRG